MHSLEDGALASRIAAAVGDKEAEAELCRRFAPRIRLYGLRHLRDAQAADDLVQEVLALSLTSLRAGRLREPAMLASFILGSCRLVVRNDRRTEQRRSARLTQFPEELAGTVDAPSLPVGDARLAGCLAGLGERERTVIVLTYYAERSGQQIAAELGLSTGNVRVVRHRALARLLECVGRGGAT